jgi:hypothetical protein
MLAYRTHYDDSAGALRRIDMRRILIDGLPRTGTTTLARLFAIHPEARVIIEPFHPRRYSGQHYIGAISSQNRQHTFDFAWKQWTVIKHVWEAGTGWPFARYPYLQKQLWLSADVVVAVSRRNLLKRHVSAEISKGLQFWIGTRKEFITRLNNVCLLPLDIVQAKRSIEEACKALAFRAQFLRESRICVKDFLFETFFNSTADQQIELINDFYTASGMRTLGRSFLLQHSKRWLNPEEYRWSSDAVYRAIPNVGEFEAAFSSQPYGSLFDTAI